MVNSNLSTPLVFVGYALILFTLTVQVTFGDTRTTACTPNRSCYPSVNVGFTWISTFPLVCIVLHQLIRLEVVFQEFHRRAPISWLVRSGDQNSWYSLMQLAPFTGSAQGTGKRVAPKPPRDHLCFLTIGPSHLISSPIALFGVCEGGGNNSIP